MKQSGFVVYVSEVALNSTETLYEGREAAPDVSPLCVVLVLEAKF
jgi:hypothetical protein